MGRNARQEAILASGRALFLRHGIRKVRVEEICVDARVSKRTFYKYFRDKNALAVEVLAQLFQDGRSQIESIFDADVPIEEKVQRIIAVKSKLASETTAVFYREAMDNRTEPGRFALQEQRAWDDRVRRFYLEAQERGQIRGDIDIDVLMAVLVRLRALVSDPELMRLVSDFSGLVEVLMKLLFYGMIPRTAPHSGRGATKRRKKS